MGYVKSKWNFRERSDLKQTETTSRGHHDRSRRIGDIHVVVSGNGTKEEFMRIRDAIRALEMESHKHSDSRISHDINIYSCT